MTPISPPLSFEETLEANARAALDAILAGLTAADKPLPSRVVYLVPGEAVVWDNACCAGQLTARLSTLVAHRSASVKPATMTPCSIDYWTATLEIVLLRCAATVDNQGVAPSADALTANGMEGASDLGIMLRAITLLEFVDDVIQWTPQGPSGGCFGTGWTFTMKIDATPCD